MIVPCGSSKVWGKDPSAGPTIARDAYVGSPFKLNRQYAERFGDRWVILSAKHGFIEPSFILKEPYEVTFKRKSSEPISVEILREQVVSLSLVHFDTVIGLGGKEYREAITTAFRGSDIKIRFPFAGLPIGKSMQATKRAIEARPSR